MDSPRRFDLARARVPRYDMLDVDRYNRLTLQTSRGCPLDCEFCGASRLISPYKIKPLAQVRRELEAILNIWPEPFIELADDNTFVSKKWLASWRGCSPNIESDGLQKQTCRWLTMMSFWSCWPFPVARRC